MRSLDGLRGVAAVLVLLCHVLITAPAFAEPYRGGEAGGTVAWLMTYTPLHLLWAGTEAVLVFFVLSGYVLALPVLSPDRGPWVAYYAQRLTRLYLPVWAALVLAVLLAESVSRNDVLSAGWWLNAHEPVDRGDVLRSAALVTEPSFSLDGPLWSLRWELLFSLLLPLFVGSALALRRRPLLTVSLLLAAVGVGAGTSTPALTYLPVFGIGVVLAVTSDRVAALAATARPTTWRWVAAAALVLLTAYWTLAGLVGPGRTTLAVGLPLEVAGASLTVVLFTHWRPVAALGETTAAQWLGARSFSLYLVHEPVVVAVAFLLHARGGTPLVLVTAVPLALLVTVAFYRFVERPSHLLARRAGAGVTRT